VIEKKDRLLELDVFRGIAAVLVVLFHFTSKTDFGGILSVGITGVDLFFIISGFVIFLTLEKTDTGKSFVINRLSRLLPAYWTCVTITFLLKISNEHLNIVQTLPAYLANLTMFQLNVFKIGDLDPAYWTMTIEMLFYIFMLFVFLCNGLKYIEWIGLAVMLLCLFNGAFLSRYHLRVHEFLNFRVPLITHFPIFYSGIIFYKLKSNKKKYGNYGFLVFAFFIQWYLFDKGGSRSDMSYIKYGVVLLTYYGLFLVYVNWGFKIIVNRIILFFGNISYSLYLIHAYLGQQVLMPWLVIHSHFNKYLILMITLAIVIFMALLINTYIEKPAMKFIRNKKLKLA